MWQAGVFAFGETFAGPSSYGETVSSDVLSSSMREISKLGGLMTIHAEQVTQGQDCLLTDHDDLRPVAGEVKVIKDVLDLNRSMAAAIFTFAISHLLMLSVQYQAVLPSVK